MDWGLVFFISKLSSDPSLLNLRSFLSVTLWTRNAMRPENSEFNFLVYLRDKAFV